MKRLFLFSLFCIILFSGCIDTTEKDDGIICNKPYIRVGNTCCLDLNDNMICDVEEISEEEEEEEEIIDTTIKLPQMQESIVHIEHTYAQGSGVIVSHDKGTLILTNKHVLEDANGIKDIKITLDDDEIIYPNEVYYAPYDLDMAIIRNYDIKGTSALIENETEITKGEDVYVIGSPMGLSKSVSSGVISNIKTINTSEGYDYEVIQTDAAMNPGNSGGGLFLKENGKLIGLVTYILSSEYGQEGLGFAVSLDEYLKLPNYENWDKFKKSLRCEDDTPYYLCSLSTPGMYCHDDLELYAFCSYCGCPEDYYCMEYSEECYICDNPEEIPWDIAQYGYACCPENEEPFLFDEEGGYGCCPIGTTPYVGYDQYICCPDGYIGAENYYGELACCPEGTYYDTDGYCYPY
jgi:hypothetical protein